LWEVARFRNPFVIGSLFLIEKGVKKTHFFDRKIEFVVKKRVFRNFFPYFFSECLPLIYRWKWISLDSVCNDFWGLEKWVKSGCPERSISGRFRVEIGSETGPKRVKTEGGSKKRRNPGSIATVNKLKSGVRKWVGNTVLTGT
jgi:hypothetical protein